MPESTPPVARAPASISVVTPAYNASAQIGNLIASLRAQSDRNFEWIVADGGSNDATLDMVRDAADLRTVVTSQPDFGIYDALNRGLRLASGDYYIVAGADDVFDREAIAKFRGAIDESGADIIVATAAHANGRAYIKKGPSWIVGEKAYIANHSLATAFRRSLHQRFGWYSRRFPIAADSLFVLLSCQGGASRHAAPFPAGTVGSGGVSYMDWAGSATELFRVQLIVGRSLIPQTFLLLLRLCKGASSRMRALHDTVFR